MSSQHLPTVDETLRALGLHIAQARKRRGWTQERLAKETGSHFRTVRRMEAGAPGTAISLVLHSLHVLDELQALQQMLGGSFTNEMPTPLPAGRMSTPADKSATVVQQSLPPTPAKSQPPVERITLPIMFGDQNVSVGHLDIWGQDGQTTSAFQYDPAWLEIPQAIAISPELPLQPGVRMLGTAASGEPLLFSALTDTTPGTWARHVIQRLHALHKNSNPSLAPLDEIHYLGAVHDDNRLGALRVPRASLPLWSLKHQRKPSDDIAKLCLALDAVWAADQGSATHEHLTILMEQGCFLGGARPKLTHVLEDGRLALVKPPRPGDTHDVPFAEVLALHMAQRAGINAAQASIWKVSNIPVAVITRFDRNPEDGRLHYVSAATLMHVNSANMANDRRGYLELLQAMRMFCADFQREAKALWRRLVFQVLITHVEDHLRSMGFLYIHGKGWRLAPVFGLNPGVQQVYHSHTPMSAELGPIRSIAMLMAHAHRFELDQEQALTVLAKVVEVVKGWRLFGNSMAMSNTNERQLRSAFEHERLMEAQDILG